MLQFDWYTVNHVSIGSYNISFEGILVFTDFTKQTFLLFLCKYSGTSINRISIIGGFHYLTFEPFAAVGPRLKFKS